MSTQEITQPDASSAPMQGTITVTPGESATVHTYNAPEVGALVATHVIELADQLIVIDAQYLLPFAREAAKYARDLKKPIARLYVTHEHPDHWFGTGEFAADAVYALPEIKKLIEQTGDQQIAGARSQMGKMVPDRATKPQVIVEPGEENIDGVRFEFRRVENAESSSLLTIGLPDEGVLITQDLLFSNVHLWIAERRFEGWAAAVERYRQLPYHRLLPGHGRPAGTELYDQVLEYLSAAEPALENASDGEQLKRALVERFPNYDGVVLIDWQSSLYLFPEAEQA